MAAVRLLARTAAAMLLFAALALAVGYAWLGTGHALDWLARQAVQRSDGRLALESVAGSLFDEVRIGRIAFKTDAYALEAGQLALRWQPQALLHGELRLSTMTAARVHYAAIPAASSAPVRLALPMRVVITEAAVTRLELDADQVIENLRLRYSGGRDAHRLELLALQTAGWNIAGRINVGAAPPFLTSGKLQAQGKALGKTAQLAATLDGSLQALKVEAAATASGAAANATALFRPFTVLPLETLTLRVNGLDLAAWNKALPRTRMGLEATAQLAAPGRLEGSVRVVNAAPGRLETNRLPLAEVRAKFAGGGQDWTFSDLDLRPPGTGRVTGFGAAQGATAHFDLMLQAVDPSRLHGRLQAVPISGRLAIAGDAGTQRVEALLDGAGLQLKIAADHTGEVITVGNAELRAGGGSLDFSGRIALTDVRAFSVTGKFSQLDPARFLQVPAARLNGTVLAQGVLEPEWRAQVSLAIADSELRGVPLTAHAEFTTRARQPFAGEGRAVIGGNRLSMSGRHGQPADRLQWDLDAANLRALDPAFAGRVKAQGTIAGSLDAPSIEFKISGRKLALRDLRAAEIEAQGALDAGIEGPLRLNAKLAGVHTPYVQLEELRLEGDGARARHTVRATLRGHGMEASLRVAGGLDPAWRWAGALDQLDARGAWPLHLSAPARLAFGRGLFAIEQLRVTALGGEFGPASVRVENGRIATTGTFRGITAETLLARLRNPAVEIRDLRLGGRWDVALAETVSGSAEVRRERGDVAMIGDETVALGLREVRFGVSATDNVLDAVLSADSETMGHASARVRTRIAQRAGQWLMPRDAPLAGSATLEMRSLGWARALAPDFDRVAGRLAAQVLFDGTLGQPRFTGAVDADEVALRVLGPGLHLSDGRLRARFDDNLLKISTLYFKAGAGKIEAEGTADIAGGLRSLDFTARAEQAQIFASPQLTVVVSGAGHAGLRDSRLALDGRFKIDEGRYDLGSERKPALGDDVVIKGRDEGQAKRPSPLRVRLDVGVDFNDKFAVRGYGLDALLGGMVQITTRGETLVAHGTIRTARGEYFAFGQSLDIERGQLIFSGPLANPGLDLRATRKVQSVEVGVEASGSLQRPVVKLVSTPAMSDSDRLSWLVLGRNPQSASQAEIAMLQAAALGVGNRSSTPLQRQIAEGLGLDELGLAGGSGGALGVLALGKRITSRLTVRLEQSLGGTAGSLVKIDYMLSQRWRLQGTTGAENAGDILFTLRFD